jgi:hypothetical protein
MRWHAAHDATVAESRLRSPWITTMQRCVHLALALGAGLMLLLASPAASAQSPAHRSFPITALRANMTVLAPPIVVVNGDERRLSPGARIRGPDNLFVLSGALVGQTYTVHYTLDVNGQLADVWVLNTTELANTPWPSTPAQAQSWAFDPLSQTWSRW